MNSTFKKSYNIHKNRNIRRKESKIEDRLNIFIDESGDFGFAKGSSRLYVISFVVHESKNKLNNQLRYLEEDMNRIKHGGMIHMAELIANREKYTEFNFEERQRVLWDLINFTKRAPIKIATIILDKKYMNSRKQLIETIERKINEFFDINKNYLNSFERLIIYYDNGQKSMGRIIDKILKKLENAIHEENFNKKSTRLFQVADMLTIIDKLEYKHNKKITFTKAEKIFFYNGIYDKIIKQLKDKRI